MTRQPADSISVCVFFDRWNDALSIITTWFAVNSLIKKFSTQASNNSVLHGPSNTNGAILFLAT